MILAAGAGAGYAYYGIMWVLGIVLGLWLYSKCARTNENNNAMAARKTLLTVSFLPCGGIQILMELWFFAQYKVHMRGMLSAGDLKKRFDNASFGSVSPATTTLLPTSANNPFGNAPTQPGQPAPPKSPSDNPFA